MRNVPTICDQSSYYLRTLWLFKYMFVLNNHYSMCRPSLSTHTEPSTATYRVAQKSKPQSSITIKSY